MNSALPPDGFADEGQTSGPPDGFADENQSNQPQRSGFDVAKDQASKFLPMFSQIGMKGMDLFQKGANKLGEATAESLASGVTPKVNPMLPFPLNMSAQNTPGKGLRTSPEVAAGVGTAIQMAPDILSTVAPMMAEKNVTEAASKGPNFLQKIGAQGINKSAGIQPSTIMKMAGGENPAKVGTELGTSLYNEGATGLSPESTFDKAITVKDQFGKAVGDALNQIKQTGINAETDASKALKPILDKWAELGDATLQQNRAMAKPYAEIFSKLEKVANAKGGTLGIDDIRNEMEEVGKLFNKISRTSDKYGPLADLYGTLADVRDSIVQDIADRAGNPDLKNQLLAANKAYSRYTRIMPDIAKAAAKEGAGGEGISLKHPIDSAANAVRPIFSKGAMAVGNAFSKGTALEKYAPALTNEATQTPDEVQSIFNKKPPMEVVYPDPPKVRPLFKKSA